ncbi:Crossover junction endonuclease mus81, partial [Basidiobolus ranarum]
MPPKKKPDVPCGNPLLLGWIGEWMEVAKSQHSKTYHSFRKAYVSMSKYPLPFSHPREATQLEGIGPGIVNKLEKKMKEYCEKNGLPLPEEVDPKPAKRLTESKDSSESQDTENIAKPRKRRVKPYVPQYRSGAYALLLGLLSGHDNPITQGFMTKEALTKEGQNYCDASFTVPLPGKHYTSWSSMKTLIDKDLVYKQGNPGRYILTESGLTLANQLSQASQTQNSNPHGSGRNSSEDEFSCSQQTSILSESENSEHEVNLSQSIKTDGSSTELPYLYVTPGDEHVRERVKASVKMNEKDFSLQYRIVYPSSSRATAYHMQVDLECHCLKDDTLLIGYIPESIAQKMAPGLSSTKSCKTTSSMSIPSDTENVASEASFTSSVSKAEAPAFTYPSKMGGIKRTDSILSEASSIGEGDALFPPINPIAFPPG